MGQFIVERMYLSNLLTVGCWNIEGLYLVYGTKLCKLDETTFQDTLNKFDILCLEETHTASEELLKDIVNFYSIPHCRKISSNNRYFGGFLLLIRKTIKKGVKVELNDDKDMLEITLKKRFLD